MISSFRYTVIMTVCVFASKYISRQYVVSAFSVARTATTQSPITRQVSARCNKYTTTCYMSNSSPRMPYDDDKMPFYALGTNLALQVGGQGNFKTLLEDDELEIVLQAFCDTMKEVTIADPRVVLSTYGPKLNVILGDRSDRVLDLIMKEGADYITNFLDYNDEAIQTNSGLVYYEMVKGTGKQPTLQSEVEVHYHGTLIDGTIFDSSVERGQTISFPLNGVIKGWQEGLQLMKEGGKATLVIPQDLAYGEGGSGNTIPGGATLKFEVELFKVS
jgi:FKBP-type peptidyl-prolyl cis-trans isomerase